MRSQPGWSSGENTTIPHSLTTIRAVCRFCWLDALHSKTPESRGRDYFRQSHYATAVVGCATQPGSLQRDCFGQPQNVSNGRMHPLAQINTHVASDCIEWAVNTSTAHWMDTPIQQKQTHTAKLFWDCFQQPIKRLPYHLSVRCVTENVLTASISHQSVKALTRWWQTHLTSSLGITQDIDSYVVHMKQ